MGINSSTANDLKKVAFTLKEAASASGISRSLLYLAISRGDLQARKYGARTLILNSDLRQFLSSLPRLANGIGFGGGGKTNV